ncbi:MAG: hypothetical protein LBT02_01980 [Rickettsiales bacterium]|jgi:hypothetical protein|nr:hypothetical protein [Rickettsiales bacterium]
MKVDLVYLWCDSNDVSWQKEKDEFFGLNKDYLHFHNTSNARYRSNDELKYSLRSVEKYVPFVDNIYIVTYKQKPDWLNTEHPKIHIVDHTEIMPSTSIPNYNSIAIELCIDNIPDLNEKYIYLNDDFLFGNFCEEKDFFNGNRPIFYMHKHHFKLTLKQLIKKGGGGGANSEKPLVKYDLLHNPTPFTKSMVKNIKRQNEEKVQITIGCHLRYTGEKYHRIDLQKEAVLQGKSILRAQKRYPVDGFVRFLNFFGYRKKIMNMETHAGCLKNILLLKEIKKYKPKTFAIEDSEKTTEQELKLFQNFLEDMFPEKSVFEK